MSKSRYREAGYSCWLAFCVCAMHRRLAYLGEREREREREEKGDRDREIKTAERMEDNV